MPGGWRRRPLRVAPLVALLLLLLVPTSLAAPDRAAALVQYVEGISPPAPGNWTGALPATRVDASLLADPSPEGRPESALAHFREMQRLLLLRSRTGAPVALALAGNASTDSIAARVSLTSSTIQQAQLTILLVEDDVAGHRFVVRVVQGPDPIDLSGGSASVERRIPVDRTWRGDQLYLVAVATRDGEAAQAAVWRAGGPASVQAAKLVLVEHATRRDCEACAPSDDAFALLASQQGDAASGAGSYARAPTFLTAAGLAIGLLAAFALWRRRPA